MTLLKKSELVAAIAEDVPNVNKADVERVLNSLQENVVAAVVEGKSVKLPGFLAFDPKTNAARTMRSPQTGEPIEVPEKKVVKVRPLTGFADAVREG